MSAPLPNDPALLAIAERLDDMHSALRLLLSALEAARAAYSTYTHGLAQSASQGHTEANQGIVVLGARPEDKLDLSTMGGT